MEEYFREEKTSCGKLLDFLVFLAVFAVTVFLILELLAANVAKAGLDIVKINQIYFYVNIFVLIIFVIDLVRLWRKSTGVKDFFEHNWLDVLATIPFGLITYLAQYTVLNALKWARVVRILRIAKLQRIARVSKISKEFKAAAHMKKESEEYKRKHRL